MALATLWLIAGIVLELITPMPLSSVAAAIAVAPLVVVGVVCHVRRWRRSKSAFGSTRLSS